VRRDWHDDVYVRSALLDMYAWHGRMDEAVAVFRRLRSRNDVPWNALITGFVTKGDGEMTLMMFVEMQRNGFQATHFTYSSVFSAIAGLGVQCNNAHMLNSSNILYINLLCIFLSFILFSTHFRMLMNFWNFKRKQKK
jgi:pentatricopeptide repeat protein